MYFKTALLASFFLVSLVSCSLQKNNTYISQLSDEKTILATDNRLEQIANLWTGHFSNAKTIKAGITNTDLEQEVIGRRIWQTKRPDEYWLYTGWFLPNNYEVAIGASLAQITRISPDTAFITFYGFSDPKSIPAFEWAKEEPFQHLSKNDLRAVEPGCGSFIIRIGEGKYKMIANEACFGPMSDLVKYYKLNAILSPDNLLFNMLLMNKDKELVFHHKNNRFDRLDKKTLERKYDRKAMSAKSQSASY